MYRNTDLTGKFDDIKRQLASTGFKQQAVDAAVSTTDNHILQHRALNQYKTCNRCKMSSLNKVGGVGNLNSPLMIVGEGLGPVELDLGIPFTGPAGNALIIMLNNLDVYRGNIYMTNVTRCNVIDAAGKWMTPDRDEIHACLIHLIPEIQIGQPKVIIALGNRAMWALTNDYSLRISQERGKILDLHEDYVVKAKVIPMWHPSYVIRQKDAIFEQTKLELWNDLKIAITLAKTLSPSYDFKTVYSI